MPNIEKFIEEYKHILLEEHILELQRIGVFLKPYELQEEVTSIHGSHFSRCPWSSNRTFEGPDSCACGLVSLYRNELNKIVNLYKRLNK